MERQSKLYNIYVKPIYGEWQKASIKQAKEFVQYLLRNCSACHTKDLPKYINKKRIKGITVEELIKK